MKLVFYRNINLKSIFPCPLPHEYKCFFTTFLWPGAFLVDASNHILTEANYFYLYFLNIQFWCFIHNHRIQHSRIQITIFFMTVLSHFTYIFPSAPSSSFQAAPLLSFLDENEGVFSCTWIEQALPLDRYLWPNTE